MVSSPLHRLFTRLLELIYPPRCVFCAAILPPGSPAYGICPDCAAALPRTGPDTVSRPGICFSFCLSPLFYSGIAAQSIRRYKFSGKFGYHMAYGVLLRDCLKQYLDQPPDLITWVPLSRRRRFSRGYDQALLLAQEAGALWGQQPVPLLKKIRNTRPQSSLSAKQRQQNARDVYRMVSSPSLTEGKRILLVDDIITTGSTLSSCAALLVDAGAEEVICLTLARTSAIKDGADSEESEG